MTCWWRNIAIMFHDLFNFFFLTEGEGRRIQAKPYKRLCFRWEPELYYYIYYIYIILYYSKIKRVYRLVLYCHAGLRRREPFVVLVFEMNGRTVCIWSEKSICLAIGFIASIDLIYKSFDRFVEKVTISQRSSSVFSLLTYVINIIFTVLEDLR